MLVLRTASVQPLWDVGVPIGLVVLTVTQLVVERPSGSPALLTVVALASVLPLVWRRRAPLAVTAVVSAGVTGQALTASAVPATFASFVAAMICVYTLARHADVVRILTGLALLGTAVIVLGLAEARTASFSAFELVYPLVYFGLAAGLGAFVRQRALRLAAVQDRAAALETELHREAALATAEERARIARELHDVVAHGLSLMVIQAEAAEELLDRCPAAAVQPLRRVQDTGRQSLAEMRRLLGVLRTPEADRATTAPQPSLRRLPDLVGEAADMGLRVDMTTEGLPVDLPPGLDLAAYRIVQESLTNVRRHAGATRACVRLRYAPEALRLEVTDDGRGPAEGRAGHGLIGMRERAALYGGTVDTGPAPGGGFRVAAVLPLQEARA